MASSKKVEKKIEKVIKKRISVKTVIGFLFGLILGIGAGFAGYYLFSDKSTPEFNMNGESIIYLTKGDTFQDPGCIAKLGDKELTVDIKKSEALGEENQVVINQAGTYFITYSIKEESVLVRNGFHLSLTRVIVVKEN